MVLYLTLSFPSIRMLSKTSPGSLHTCFISPNQVMMTDNKHGLSSQLPCKTFTHSKMSNGGQRWWKHLIKGLVYFDNQAYISYLMVYKYQNLAHSTWWQPSRFWCCLVHVWCGSAWSFLPLEAVQIWLWCLKQLWERWKGEDFIIMNVNDDPPHPPSHINMHTHIFHPAVLLQCNLCGNYYNPLLGMVVIFSDSAKSHILWGGHVEIYLWKPMGACYIFM